MKVKSCRLCLAVQVKVTKIGNTAAKKFIESILKENGFKWDLCKSHYICYVCKALLEKSHNFIQRVITAQHILNDILQTNKKITLTSLKEIDRQTISHSDNMMIHVSKNIDIYPTDYDNKNHLKANKSGLLNYIKEENDFDIIEVNSPIDDIMTIEKFETVYEVDSDEYMDSNTVKTTNKHYIDDNDPIFSEEEERYIKIKKQKSTEDNKNDTDIIKKPVKKKKSRKLEPSKFILSLSNVGDKSERRKKQCIFKDYDDADDKAETNERDEYQPESSEETSDSDYDMYDDSGKRVGKPKREYPRKCDHCEYEVPKACDHYKHYLFMHPEKPYPYPTKIMTFVCQFCGKISKSKPKHLNHELTHSKKKEFGCDQCPKFFFNRVQLLRHVKTTHTKKFYECDCCSKKIKTREEFVRHFRIHTGEKPYKCHICGAGFAHKGNIGIHIHLNHEQLKDDRKTTKCKPQRKRKDSSDDSLMNLLQLKESITIKNKTIKQMKNKN